MVAKYVELAATWSFAAGQTVGLELLLRRSRQEFTIDEPSRDFRRQFSSHSNIISDTLITPVKNASVFFDHC